MLRDQDANTVYLSDLLRTSEEFEDTCQAIADALIKHNVTYKFLPSTRDIWARDYMPTQVSEDKFVEFRYDPDYLQGIDEETRELKTYPDIVCQKLGIDTIKTDIIIDGGNIIRSTSNVIMTDKVLWENRRLYAKDELLEKLKELFEVQEIVLIPWDKEDIFGHADGMLRFIDDNTVLVHGLYNAPKDPLCKKLIDSLTKAGLNIVWMEFDLKHPDLRNWAYINFLQTKDILIIPKFHIEEDEQALKQVELAYPDYASRNAIEQVDMSEVVEFGGALNCISWVVKE